MKTDLYGGSSQLMWRIVPDKLSWASMRKFLALICISAVASCGGSNSVLNQRVEHWRNLLSANVHAGSTKEETVNWGLSESVKFSYLEQQHWLYANVEKVPETGIRFPCSEWNIILKVLIDEKGKVISHEVNTVGSCI